MENSNCFIISPIGAEESEVRKRADKVLKFIISPAIEGLDLTAVRADHISEPGLITSQILQHIVNDKLVIADLTGHNPNVFYELAVRHAIRKPWIQIITAGETIPFDLAGMRTIYYDLELESAEKAKVEIQGQAKTVLSKSPDELDSPITIAIHLQALRQSESTLEQSFGELINEFIQLKSTVNSIDSRLKEAERGRIRLAGSHVGSIDRSLIRILSDIDKKGHLDQQLKFSLLDKNDVNITDLYPWLIQLDKESLEVLRKALKSNDSVSSEE